MHNSTKNDAVSGKKYLGSAVGEQRRVNCGNNLENGVIFCRQGRDEPGFQALWWSVVVCGGK